MLFTKVAAVLALAASVTAHSNDTVIYTTIVVDSYVTYCPASSAVVFNSVTYSNTLTEAANVTITNCPCTVSAPVYTTSSVYCNTCAVPTTAPSVPVYSNTTSPAVVSSATPSSTAVLSSAVASSTAAGTTSTPAPIISSGANKAFTLSFSLAGLLGLAAYVL